MEPYLSLVLLLLEFGLMSACLLQQGGKLPQLLVPLREGGEGLLLQLLCLSRPVNLLQSKKKHTYSLNSKTVGVILLCLNQRLTAASPECLYFLLVHFHHVLQLCHDAQHVFTPVLLLEQLLADFDQLSGSQPSQFRLLLLELRRLFFKLLQLLNRRNGRRTQDEVLHVYICSWCCSWWFNVEHVTHQSVPVVLQGL